MGRSARARQRGGRRATLRLRAWGGFGADSAGDGGTVARKGSFPKILRSGYYRRYPMTGMRGSRLDAADLLIGVDDTDNLTSAGTGRLVQALLAAMEAEGLGTGVGATRHQLFVDPRIPYTSHNSSACLAWSATSHGDDVVRFVAHFLEAECAPGSDPGLAVVEPRVWVLPACR